MTTRSPTTPPPRRPSPRRPSPTRRRPPPSAPATSAAPSEPERHGPAAGRRAPAADRGAGRAGRRRRAQRPGQRLLRRRHGGLRRPLPGIRARVGRTSATATRAPVGNRRARWCSARSRSPTEAGRQCAAGAGIGPGGRLEPRMGILDRILRAGEGKKLKALQAMVPDVNALEPGMQKLTDDRAAGQDRGVPPAPGQRRRPRRHRHRGLRRHPRGRRAGHRATPLRRPADGRCGAALRMGRRDEDRRGQDPGVDAARLTSTASAARASTWSRSTTTSPASTPSGWDASTASSGSRSA